MRHRAAVTDYICNIGCAGSQKGINIFAYRERGKASPIPIKHAQIKGILVGETLYSCCTSVTLLRVDTLIPRKYSFWVYALSRFWSTLEESKPKFLL